MGYPETREEVRFRGRDFHATETDMLAFLADVSVALPNARLFNRYNWERWAYPEIELEEAARLFSVGDGFLVVFDPEWHPEIGPHEKAAGKHTLLDFPLPMVRFDGRAIQTIPAQELDRPIRVCRPAMADGQCLRGNKHDERLVDKLLRIHRKHVSKEALVYDLKTGKVVGEEDSVYWFGPDMARRSREEEDLYLDITFLHHKDEFYGFKARPE